MHQPKIGRGSITTNAHTPDGAWREVDVLDLDDESFRAFLLQRLADAGLIRARAADGDPVVMRVRSNEGPGHIRRPASRKRA